MGSISGKLPGCFPRIKENSILRTPTVKRGPAKFWAPIFFGFRFDGKDAWKDGKVCDAQTDITYQAYMKVQGHETLILSVFILIPLFGRSEKFHRVDQRL